MPQDNGNNEKPDGDTKPAPLNIFASPSAGDNNQQDPLALAIKPLSGFKSKPSDFKTSTMTMGEHYERHEHKEAPENRISELIASGLVGENFRKWVKKNNTNIMMLGAAPLYLGLSFANQNPFQGMDIPILSGDSLLDANPYVATGLTLAAPIFLNDVAENFIKAARTLNQKGIISDKKLSAMGAAFHTGTEIASASVNAVRGAFGAESVAGKLAINLTSTFAANTHHYGLMFFGTAAFWRMGFPSKEEWFAHAKGIAGTTAGLGVPVLADAGVQAISQGWIQTTANIANRGAGAIASYQYGTEYMSRLDEFGDECPVCGTIHGSAQHQFTAEPAKVTLATPKKETLRTHFTQSVKALPNATKEYAQSIPQRMKKIPSNTYATLKNIAHTSKLMVNDHAGRDAIKSVLTTGAVSYGMLHNIDVIAQGFALTKSSSGALHGIAHSLPETLFMFKAAAKGEKNMAIGAFGGCVASMSILGGFLLASGADIGETMRGTLMQAAYLAPPALALVASYPDVMKWAGKADETASQWLKDNVGDRAKRASDWLKNDGTSIARWIAVPAFAASVAASVAISSQTCHSHFDGSVDCGAGQFNMSEDIQKGFGLD